MPMPALGDKRLHQSATILGAAIFTAASTAEGLGVIPPGVAESLATVAQGFGALLAAFGVRRAISANGLGALDADEDPDPVTDDAFPREDFEVASTPDEE